MLHYRSAGEGRRWPTCRCSIRFGSIVVFLKDRTYRAALHQRSRAPHNTYVPLVDICRASRASAPCANLHHRRVVRNPSPRLKEKTAEKFNSALQTCPLASYFCLPEVLHKNIREKLEENRKRFY